MWKPNENKSTLEKPRNGKSNASLNCHQTKLVRVDYSQYRVGGVSYVGDFRMATSIDVSQVSSRHIAVHSTRDERKYEKYDVAW